MSSLAEVLAWKFNDAPGIRTRESSTGGMEIFDWPAALGSIPTASQITRWTAEYDALLPPPAPLTTEELYDMLAAKNLVGPGDRPRPKPD